MDQQNALLAAALAWSLCLSATAQKAGDRILSSQSLSVSSSSSSVGVGAISAAGKAQVMIVGAYHFISKANVHSFDVDDPTTPKRQAEILDLVEHLKRFQPTKIVLEETSGTSYLEQNYQQFLSGKFILPPSENYQIGFRLAKLLGMPRIYLTSARTDFDYESLIASAKAHQEGNLLSAADALSESLNRASVLLQAHGTILDMYRFNNSDETIKKLNAPYMLLARIGANTDFAGAKVVASWHLRNLEMFAQLTRLIDSPDERILMLYGAGHTYLLRDCVEEIN